MARDLLGVVLKLTKKVNFVRNEGERDEDAEGWSTGGRCNNSAVRRFRPGFSAMHLAQ